MNISVIIPALNEELSVTKVINDIPRQNIKEIIVVDNGSSDKTAEHACKAGARVVREPFKGYGSACLAGIKALRSETDIVVFLDADYSDYPEELPKIIGPIIKEGYDMVIGSRLLSFRNQKAISKINRLGNRFACRAMKAFFNMSCTDLGPFRAIRRSSLEALNMKDINFGWTIEMQIKASLKGLRIKEVPVLYRKRLGRAKITGTFLGSVKACAKITYTILKYLIMIKYTQI